MSDTLPSTVPHNGRTPVLNSDTPDFHPPKVPGDLGVLAGYRVIKLLGRGGMGAVYLAHDEGLDRKVALKVMLPRYAADLDAKQRFLREARAVAAVKHINVVMVFQVGEDNGMPFIAMEFLSGYPLDEYLKRKGRLTIPQALRVGAETAAGLAAAHEKGLIHRDIKPANLWLEAPEGRIKILDFGLAKAIDPGEQDRGLTRTGIVLGTPAYMAPEQARGEVIDHRSDLFTLGIVLYQLCTGKRPFDRQSSVASMIALATEEPPPVQSLNPEVPESFARVIHALLAKDPAHRLQTATEVAKLLRAIERGEHSPELRELTVMPTAAQPQVVYVPIHVTAYEPGPNEFANLTDPTDASTAPKAHERTENKSHELAGPPARFPVWIIAVGLLLILGIATAAFFAFRKPEEVAKTPDLPKNEVKPGGKDNGKVIPSPPPKTNPEREVAEWVFSKGGTVTLLNGATVASAEKLPPQGPVGIVTIWFGESLYPLADADVAQFRACRDLRRIAFTRTDLTDKGFKDLVELPQAAEFTDLKLPAKNATATGAAELTKCPKLNYINLTDIPLTGNMAFLKRFHLASFTGTRCGLTNTDLEVFYNTPINGLVLSENPKITEAGVEKLAENTKHIHSLDLSLTGITPKGASVLAKFPILTYLRFVGIKLTDNDLGFLESLPKLHTLMLSEAPISDRGLDTIIKLSQLRTLILSYCDISDAGLEKLKGLPNLVELHLQGTKVTTPGVKRFLLEKPKCIVRFDYKPQDDPDRRLAEWIIGHGGSVTWDGGPKAWLADLSHLPNEPIRVFQVNPPGKYVMTNDDIERFRGTSVIWYALGGPHNITNEGMKKWSELPGIDKVRCFQVRNDTITAEGYAHLVKFQSLEALHLTDTKATNEVLVVCHQLPKLNTLSLNRTLVTDEGLKHLRGLKLQSINLISTAVGNDGAESLATIETLEKLLLHDTKLTDAGLAKLHACKNLKELHVSNTGVSKDGVKKFQAAVPNCKVISNPAK